MNKHFINFLKGIGLKKDRWNIICEHEFLDMMRSHLRNSTNDEDSCVQNMILWYLDTEPMYRKAPCPLEKLIRRTACYSEARMWVELIALQVHGWVLKSEQPY